MRKSISVYTRDSNPGVDSPVFWITRTEADARLERGYATWLSPTSIQTREPGWSPNEETLVSAGTVGEAWKRRWSGDYLVMQLVGQGT